MPVVMLLLILMPLTMAGELCMLCQCLFLGRGRARPKAGPSGRGRPAPAGGLAGGRRPAGDGGPGLAAVGVRRTGGGSCHRRGLRWPSSCPGSCIRCSRGQESPGQDLLLSDCACAGGLSWAAVHAGAVEGSGQGVGGADRGGGVQRHFPGDWIPLCKLVRPRGAGLCVGGLRQWSGGGWSGPWRGRRRS